MSKPTIVCPTHGRAGDVKTLQVFGPDLLLCVAQSQLPLYREHYPAGNFEVHPDDVVGLSAKRQWIYERFGDVFMVDDDIRDLYCFTFPPGQSPVVTDPELARDLVYRAADTAADLGAYLYGFNQSVDPAVYHPQHPLRVTGYIGGHALGMRAGSKLWFPRKGMHGSEDMWICALNAYHHRFVFVDQRYAFGQVATFRAKGGLAATRTEANLRQNFEVLRAAFGPAISRKRDTSRARRAHAHQITLKLPW